MSAAPGMSGTTFSVIAEDAPIGVQLWPTRSPEDAPNFTLASVRTIRDERSSFVEWTYQNGKVRHFEMGETVVCTR